MALAEIVKKPLGIAAVVGVAALGVGLALGYLLLQRDVQALESRLDEQRQQATELEERLSNGQATLREVLDFLGEANELGGQLRVQLDDLLQQLATVTEERNATLDQLESTQIEASQSQDTATALEQTLEAVKETVAGLENDRLLLIELRKDQPQERQAALQFWQSIKSVAVRSDPALGPRADRVLEAAPTYFDWVEGDYASTGEASQAYFVSGAFQFEDRIRDFTRDVLLLVIERIDTVADLTN